MRYVIVIVLLAMIGAGAYYYAVGSNGGPRTETHVPERYVSNTYGYSFDIPAGHRIKGAVDAYVTVTDTTGAEGRAEIQVAQSGATDDSASFAAFAHAAAALSCDADGPTGSARCTGVSRTEPFVSEAGERGEVFYLEYVFTQLPGGATTTREAGPFYAFDLGQRPGHAYTALIVRSTFGAEESERYDEGVVIAHDVAASIRLPRS